MSGTAKKVIKRKKVATAPAATKSTPNLEHIRVHKLQFGSDCVDAEIEITCNLEKKTACYDVDFKLTDKGRAKIREFFVGIRQKLSEYGIPNDEIGAGCYS